MVKKILLFVVVSSFMLSGCGNAISADDSTPSAEIIPNSVSVEESTVEEAIVEPETYTSLGVSVDDISAKINNEFSNPVKYTYQTDEFNITLIVNLWHDNVYTQQCVLYTYRDSNDVLCIRLMDTNDVLVKNDSASQTITNCIKFIISLLNIPESSYTAAECEDKNFDYSYCIYPVDVDSAVLLQPQSFDIPLSSTTDSPSEESDPVSESSSPSTSSNSTVAPSTSEVTTGQKNALKKAKQYLEIMSFSYSGLVKQLEYEGYSNDECIYAVDNCGADWNEQAALKAASYLEIMPFSRNGLIKQLEYDGFTHDQAVYGVESNGY